MPSHCVQNIMPGGNYCSYLRDTNTLICETSLDEWPAGEMACGHLLCHFAVAIAAKEKIK